jgi:hypothetical protein
LFSIAAASARPRVIIEPMSSLLRAGSTFVVALALAAMLTACKSKPPAPDRNPYREVMPDKMKQKVEDAQKKEEQRDDKLLENAK